MERKFLDAVTAGIAIKQLVSNIEGKEYNFDNVPVRIRIGDKLEKYYVFLIYEKGKQEEVLSEVNNNFKSHDVNGFLTPSKNYVQIAFFEDSELEFYKHKITFARGNGALQKGQMVSCIVDPKYAYIDDVMNRWFEFDEKLEVHKSDDIYQYIDSISQKRVKKEGFVKKLFKSKKD